MAIRITLECGHASMLRVRTTPEGYTHDWEVFVRGVDNADISQYVEKVVFHLHETFPRPKRVLKEAPYVVKESGYAGFVIPIYIYLKNKDEPKRIHIMYDLTLQQSGPAINSVIRHSEIITNPADDFRRKLLKGGGVSVSTSDESHDKSDSKVPVPMVGKPKLSGADAKKHRPVEPRSTNQFADLFGTPIKTANKVSPEAKKPEKPYHKTPPEKPDKSKSKYSPHKDPKKEKSDDKKEKKEKDVKDKDRSKEKLKRPSPPKTEFALAPKRPQSPPSKKQLSPHDPNIQKSSSPKIRDKDHKKLLTDREKHPEKPKDAAKPAEDVKTDKRKRKHKDDKEAERKEKREKEREKKDAKPAEKKPEKHEKPEKEKEKLQENRPKEEKKSPKPKDERSSSKSRPEKDDKKEQKVEKDRQKHKHRKKDKKERSDDSREREKREKREKQKTYEKEPTPAPNPLSTLLAEVQERDSSDTAGSADDEDKQPIAKDVEGSRLVPEVRLTRPASPGGSGKRSEKVKKEKSKPRTEDRKRKRRSDSKEDEVPVKREKDGFSPPLEPVSSSQSPVPEVGYANIKEDEDPKEAFEEQIAPDSTNNILVESENEEPLVFSDDYVSQLKDLQQKIMTLQDNQELQRVVQVIAATGQYEITRKTFDFDLCALDRRTVQRLQQFFSAS